MKRIVLATRNAHKVGELRAILADLGVEVDLVGVTDYPDVPDVAETELSFAGNALLKAVAVAEATGLPAIADDSGICVDALNGMPGIFSARWAGRHGEDGCGFASFGRRQVSLDAHDAAVLDQHVEMPIDPARRVDDPGALKQLLHPLHRRASTTPPS